MDFSHIERGEDMVYEQHKVESEHAVMERGARFLQWIMARSALEEPCKLGWPFTHHAYLKRPPFRLTRALMAVL